MAISLVQYGGGAAFGNPGVSQAFPSNVTAGNLLIATISSDADNDTVVSLTDTLGHTWVQATGPTTLAGKGTHMGIWYVKNCLGGANTVSFTATTGGAYIQIAEYSGADLTAPLDVTAAATGSGTSTPSSGSATTTAAGDLLVGSCWNNRSNLTAGTGYTVRGNTAWNSFISYEDQIAGAAGSYVADGSITTTGSWIMHLASFKAASGGGGGGSAKVSTATGNWNAGGTWVGGVVPVSGDTVTIATGHTVTVPSGYTAVCGTSPASSTGTPALQVNGTGKLVVNGTFRYQGPVTLEQGVGVMTVNAGGVLEHDSSLATIAANANYVITVGTIDLTRTTVVLNGTGTGANRVTLRKFTGSGNAGGFSRGAFTQSTGLVQGTYVTASDFGTASVPFVNCSLRLSGDHQFFENSILTGCGAISADDVRDGCNFYLLNTSIKSPVAGVVWGTSGGGNGFSINPATGTRGITGGYIEGQVNFGNASGNDSNAGLVFSDTVLAGTTSLPPIVASANCGVTTWNNVTLFNRVAATGGASQPPKGTLSRSLLLRIGGSGNGHWVDRIKTTLTFDVAVVEEGDASGGSGGDIFQLEPRNGSRGLATFTRIVVLPDTTGISPGAFVNSSFAGGADNGTTVQYTQAVVEHCVWPGDDGGTQTEGCGGENNTGYGGNLFTSIRSNIVYRLTSGLGWITKWQDSTTPQAGTYGNCNYNSWYNLTGERYNRVTAAPTTYSSTPGVNDVNTAPAFVDATRKLLTWAQTLDATVTTWAHVLDRFSRRNDDTGAIAGFTTSAAITWIQAGFASTAAPNQNAGHDGTDMGAVPYGSNLAPTATITAPATGTSVAQGTLVTFTGTGVDPEDGTMPGSALAWSSSINGALGTGLSLATSALSVGVHTITLTATDTGSLTDSKNITLTVTATGGGGGLPNISALPVANRQKPLWLDTGVNNLRTAAAGSLLLDPTTSVRVTKRTSLTSPAANATGYNHAYSSGGYLISKPWGTGSANLTIYFFADGAGTGYVQDITLGTTTASAARATPWSSDLRYTFSPKAGEEHIVYYFTGAQRLVRYDTTAGTMAEAANATFPAGGKDFSARGVTGQGQYLQTDVSGRYFVWMNGAGTAVHWWDSQTDTLRTLLDTDIGPAGNIDEPHFDRDSAGRYVVVKLTTYTNVGGDFRNHKLWDAQTDTFSDLIFGASHTDWVRGIVVGADPNSGNEVRFAPTPLSGGRAASPVAAASAGTQTQYLSDTNFGAGEVHNAGQWDQGAIGTSAYLLASVEAPGYWRTPSPWTIDTGSVYKATMSYQYQQATTQVTDVIRVNASNTQVLERLTNVATRGAMTAGTWCIVGTTLYVWKTDSSAVAGEIQVFIQHKIADGLGFFKADGTDVRFLAHHYSYNPSLDYFTSPRATISPCGRLVVYTSNLHNGTGPHFVMTAEVPLTASSATALAMVTDPSNGRTGVALPTQPSVKVVDAGGSTVTTDTSTVTAALITVTGTGTAIGTLTKAAVAGIADFAANGLGVTSTGGGTFKWRFTDGALTSVDSAVFTVVGTAAALAMIQQPSNIPSGSIHTNQPSVKVVDAQGSTVTTDTSTVTAALVNVIGTGTTIGTLTKAAVAGIADFATNNLGVTSVAGGTFKWRFTDGVLTSVDSNTFLVAADPVGPGTGPSPAGRRRRGGWLFWNN